MSEATLGVEVGTPLQETHSEEGVWVSAGRLATLVGESECMALMGVLPKKFCEDTQRELFFYTEEKMVRKACQP